MEMTYKEDLKENVVRIHEAETKILHPGDPGHKPVQLYLAGPMRGYEYFNFPAFDKYQKQLEDCGWKVLSPAEMDRESGFDPKDENFQGIFAFDDNCDDWPDVMDADAVIRRDMEAIMDPETKAMAVMPGWFLSTGAVAEYYLARMRGLYIFAADTGEEVNPDHVETVTLNPHDEDDLNRIQQVFDKSDPKDICDEAKEITSGARNQDYGPPDIDMTRTAAFWTAYLGTKVTMFDVPQMMTLLKISREKHFPKRDNPLDSVGYQRIYQLMREGKQP
jgi:hypothetical protein